MPTYQERVRQAIDTHVPPHLRAYFYQMTAKESPTGKDSPTGAQGPLQFTRGTGKSYGLVGPQGDVRRDIDANIKAGVPLTLDNAAILRKRLGREPTFSELALAHQQGASTAGNMLTGAGNAPAKNLAVNNINPNLPPQAAAEKIMNYYGFDKRPGMTLNSASPMFDPNAPGAFAPPAQGAVPFAAGFQPPGLSLASNPAAAAAPASFAERMLSGANNPNNKGTPFANTFEGLGDIQKGISPKAPAANDMNTIAPSSLGASVGQQQAAMSPIAQNILTQMIQQMQQRRGVR